MVHQCQCHRLQNSPAMANGNVVFLHGADLYSFRWKPVGMVSAHSSVIPMFGVPQNPSRNARHLMVKSVVVSFCTCLLMSVSRQTTALLIRQFPACPPGGFAILSRRLPYHACRVYVGL